MHSLNRPHQLADLRRIVNTARAASQPKEPAALPNPYSVLDASDVWATAHANDPLPSPRHCAIALVRFTALIAYLDRLRAAAGNPFTDDAPDSAPRAKAGG